jgi:hypothetical protein
LLNAATEELACEHCHSAIAVPRGAVRQWTPDDLSSTPSTPGEELSRCVVCPSEELYVRKDFPQRLGVAIVVLGIALSSITWYYRLVYLTYGIFFGTALLDFVMWLVMGNVLQCYRCQARYRGVAGIDRHGGFDLETHEKHRQQLARLAEAQAARQASP